MLLLVTRFTLHDYRLRQSTINKIANKDIFSYIDFCEIRTCNKTKYTYKLDKMNNEIVEAKASTNRCGKSRLLQDGRIAYLDALKAFAILLVIEGHVRILGMGISPYESLSGLMLYSFEIPIFFFVSGYLAFKETLPFRMLFKSVINKFLLLVIPAIVFRTVLNLVEHNSLLSPIYDGFGKYWFTITLFECFLVYYLIQSTLKRSILVNAAMILISLVGIAMLGRIGNIGPRIMDLGHLSRYFYFFAIGIFARKYQEYYKKMVYSQWFRTIIIIVFFLLLFLLDYNIWSKPLYHLFRDVILRLLGTIMIVILFASHEGFINKSRRLKSIIEVIGGKTLPIYLLQYFFIPSFNTFSERIACLDMFTIHLISFGYTLFIIGACLVFLYLLEQSSFIKKLLLQQKK